VAIGRRSIIRGGVATSVVALVGALSSSSSGRPRLPAPGGQLTDVADVRRYRSIQEAADSGHSVLYFPPGDWYVWGTISLPPTVRRVTGGGRMIARGDYPVFARSGSRTSPTPLENVPVGATEIVCRGRVNVVAGDSVYIGSSDLVKDANYGNQTRGYLRNITSVDGKSVRVDAPVPRALTTDPKMHYLTLAPSIRIDGLSFTAEIQETMKSPCIQLTFVQEPILEDLTVSGLAGSAILLDSCSGGIAINCHISDLLDDAELGYLGYAFNVSGATRGFEILSGDVARVRHAFTTNGGIYGGEPENIVVSLQTMDCTAAAMDTHEQGWNLTMYPDDLGSPIAVQVRADNTNVVNAQIRQYSRCGIMVADNVADCAIIAPSILGSSASVAGISVGARSSATIREPVLLRPGAVGIVSDGSATVVGGRIDLVDRHGTGIRLNSSGNEIQGTAVTNCATGLEHVSGNSWSGMSFEKVLRSTVEASKP
jgi:hypothetical protein